MVEAAGEGGEEVGRGQEPNDTGGGAAYGRGDELSHGGSLTFREHMRRAAAEYLEALLLECPSTTEAARIAGLNRTHLYRLCKKYGVAPPRRRNSRGELWGLYGL